MSGAINNPEFADIQFLLYTNTNNEKEEEDIKQKETKTEEEKLIDIAADAEETYQTFYAHKVIILFSNG